MEQRTPVPDPLFVGTGRRIVRCPDCQRRFPVGQRARYDLHWRLTHDVIKPLGVPPHQVERDA